MKKIKYLSPIPDNLNFTSSINRRFRFNNMLNILSSTGSLSFNGYANDANKNFIRKLANGCCAYCGARIGNQTITVEHYRPKAKLEFLDNDCYKYQYMNIQSKFKQDRDICHYGYFLWGDDSKNLLPSCEACNTGQGKNGVYVSNQILYNIPYGKKNFFPISLKKQLDTRKGLLYISTIDSEKPLLFNPFQDNPEELFIYKDYEKPDCHIKIKVNPNAPRSTRLKAMTTINLLGLNRRYLCNQRYKVFQSYKNVTQLLVEGKKSSKNEKFWKNLAFEYLNLFDNDKSEFIGYAMFLEKKYKIGNLIEDYIITYFSPTKFHKSSDTLSLINQLKQYAKKQHISLEQILGTL
ncbi:HNH endonuclease [Sulfurimonas microaerophilic]|uniref:HNH endonuclease n=1 Tax=Sulfurimonas microaerophilic TaxID=3058392 RepID=UPI002714B867|nr:hypothetical protein [Sulfurimonas sp. hsl 1-7]